MTDLEKCAEQLALDCGWTSPGGGVDPHAVDLILKAYEYLRLSSNAPIQEVIRIAEKGIIDGKHFFQADEIARDAIIAIIAAGYRIVLP